METDRPICPSGWTKLVPQGLYFLSRKVEFQNGFLDWEYQNGFLDWKIQNGSLDWKIQYGDLNLFVFYFHFSFFLIINIYIF